MVHQKYFVSYWSGKTVDFICIYRELLLNNTIKFNMLLESYCKHTLSLSQEFRRSIYEPEDKHTPIYESQMHVCGELISFSLGTLKLIYFFFISTAICLWLSLWYEESYKYQNLFHSLPCGGNFCLFLVGNMREEVTENRQEGDQKMLSFWWCHFWMALSLWPLSWRRSLSYRKQSSRLVFIW